MCAKLHQKHSHQAAANTARGKQKHCRPGHMLMCIHSCTRVHPSRHHVDLGIYLDVFTRVNPILLDVFTHAF